MLENYQLIFLVSVERKDKQKKDAIIEVDWRHQKDDQFVLRMREEYGSEIAA